MALSITSIVVTSNLRGTLSVSPHVADYTIGEKITFEININAPSGHDNHRVYFNAALFGSAIGLAASDINNNGYFIDSNAAMITGTQYAMNLQISGSTRHPQINNYINYDAKFVPISSNSYKIVFSFYVIADIKDYIKLSPYSNDNRFKLLKDDISDVATLNLLTTDLNAYAKNTYALNFHHKLTSSTTSDEIVHGYSAIPRFYTNYNNKHWGDVNFHYGSFSPNPAKLSCHNSSVVLFSFTSLYPITILGSKVYIFKESDTGTIDFINDIELIQPSYTAIVVGSNSFLFTITIPPLTAGERYRIAVLHNMTFWNGTTTLAKNHYTALSKSYEVECGEGCIPYIQHEFSDYMNTWQCPLIAPMERIKLKYTVWKNATGGGIATGFNDCISFSGLDFDDLIEAFNFKIHRIATGGISNPATFKDVVINKIGSGSIFGYYSTDSDVEVSNFTDRVEIICDFRADMSYENSTFRCELQSHFAFPSGSDYISYNAYFNVRESKDYIINMAILQPDKITGVSILCKSLEYIWVKVSKPIADTNNYNVIGLIQETDFGYMPEEADPFTGIIPQLNTAKLFDFDITFTGDTSYFKVDLNELELAKQYILHSIIKKI